jgi:demethylspheroidene O-methyltransferase
VFERLRDGPLHPPVLALRLQLPPERCRVLLRAAASLRLLEARAGGAFGLGPLGAALLDNPAVLGMVAHHALFYRDLADPLAVVRGEADCDLARYWAYAGSTPGGGGPPAAEVASYSQLMSISQALVADQVLDAYPFARHRILLDVGGGEGEFVRAVLQRHSQLEGRVFDLPAVAERASSHLARMLPERRWQALGGDFRSDPIPPGADLITLVRVAHDHDDEVVMPLLRAIRRALAPGGTFLLAEPLAGTPGAEPMGDAYFGLYFLAMGSGRPRTFAELRSMLLAAGFRRVRLRPTAIPLQTSVIEAR